MTALLTLFTWDNATYNITLGDILGISPFPCKNSRSREELKTQWRKNICRFGVL